MTNLDNHIVNAISKLNIEGNIIPTTWYKFFTFDNGKPDLIAIHILSDIVYWYRPTVKRCEETGQVIGVYKKFKADLLQRSYDSFAEWLGVSKRQVKEAMDRLEKKGVIFREFRSISASIHNVLFIGINVDILATSLLHSNVPPPTFERTTPYVQTHTPLHSNVPPPTSERKTNTKITTENTTKITTESDYAPTPKSEQTHFADEKNSQGTSDNKATSKTSSAKKPTITYAPPSDLTPTPTQIQKCEAHGIDAHSEFENFTSWAIANGKGYANWSMGFSTWIKNSIAWGKPQPTKPTWQQNPTAFANQPNPDRKSELEALATQFADDFYQSGYPGQNVIDITPNGDYS